MADSLITQLLKDHPFNKTMSIGARRLRDDVYSLCCSHINPNDTEKFIKYIRDNYNRINWEKAIFYHHNERIYEGILRKTSEKFNEKPNNNNPDKIVFKKGTKAAGVARRKDIDWFNLAVFADSSFWIEMIDFPREKLHLNPDDIDKIEPSFTSMYELVTDWLLTDFNFSSLYNIYEFARDDSIEFIKECMSKVDDIRKRNTGYLAAIMKQERAALKYETEEDDSLTAHSKLVIAKMVEMANNKENVNWDDIEREAIVGETNRSEFEKVKLT